MRDTPPLGLIDLPWFVVLDAPGRAEEMDREHWIRCLAEKWRLVIMDEPERTLLCAVGNCLLFPERCFRDGGCARLPAA